MGESQGRRDAWSDVLVGGEVKHSFNSVYRVTVFSLVLETGHIIRDVP